MSARYVSIASMLCLLLASCSPKSAVPEGRTTVATGASGSLCSAHGAPKELCFICDASLREEGRLWCRGHNRYEDRCWMCHPELQDRDRLFCNRHGLYEDECFLCDSERSSPTSPAVHARQTGESDPPAGHSRGPGDPGATDLYCAEHGVRETECGICHPELLAEEGTVLKVRLPSAKSARLAGVEVVPARSAEYAGGVECFAELVFNQNQLAQITTLVDGVIRVVQVDLGQTVEQGEVLAEVMSPAVGAAQSTLLKTLAEDRLSEQTLERERLLQQQRITSESELQQAQANRQAAAVAVQAARQQLRVLGFDASQIESLAEARVADGTVEIRTPLQGEIIKRTAVPGTRVEMGSPLFTVADTRSLWGMLSIPETDLPRVRRGQQVELTFKSLPGERFYGQLTWVAAEVDHRTRMAQARVEVANPEGRLKANMFARARILTEPSQEAIVLPAAAVHSIAGQPVVFVRLEEDLYEARPVKLGNGPGADLAILEGLKEDEQVAIAGVYALKSQLLISRLGAGCTH